MAEKVFEEVKIVEGPAKFDFVISLFDGKRVEFTYEGGGEYLRPQGKLDVVINGAQAEDGSRESWNISGMIFNAGTQPFQGYYQTRRRKGYLKLVE